jgi:hypothetical protein
MGRDKRAARAEDRTITLIPIEPLNERHGALVVEAFGRLFIDAGGQPDGYGGGTSYGGGGWGYGYGWRDGDGGRRAT